MLSRRDRRRLLVMAALGGLAVMLAVMTVALLVASILLALLTVLSPALATFLTAICLTLSAVAVLLVLRSQKRRHRRGFGELERLVPGLVNLIQKRPMGAVGAALALGLVSEFLQQDKKSSRRRS